MEAVKVFLKDLIEESKSPSNVFKRNILKEYLQVLVLDFIIPSLGVKTPAFRRSFKHDIL